MEEASDFQSLTNKQANTGGNVTSVAEVLMQTVRLELYCDKRRRMCAGLTGVGERRS